MKNCKTYIIRNFLVFFMIVVGTDQIGAQDSGGASLILSNELSVIQQEKRFLDVARGRMESAIDYLSNEENFAKVKKYDDRKRLEALSFFEKIKKDKYSIDDISDDDASYAISLVVDYFGYSNISIRINDAKTQPTESMVRVWQSTDDAILMRMIDELPSFGDTIYEDTLETFKRLNPEIEDILSEKGLFPDLYSVENGSFEYSKYKLILNYDKILVFLKKPTHELDREITEYFVRVSDKIISDKINKAKSVISYIDEKISTYNTEISNKAKELEAINNKINIKAQIDEQLVYAVYMMIGALLILFLIISKANENIVSDIISSRSLVESVGIAFLLITIIILGTGEKVEETTLGTLLGTIAGYIFGSGVARSNNNKS